QSHSGRGSRIRALRNHPRSYWLLGYLNTRPRTTYMVRVMNPNPRLRTPVDNPFEHHGGHGDEHNGHGDHGHDHSAPHGRAPYGDGGMTRSAFLRDSAKVVADKGYALSLRVLGGVM